MIRIFCNAVAAIVIAGIAWGQWVLQSYAAPSTRATTQVDADSAYKEALHFEHQGKWQKAVRELDKCVQAAPKMESAWIELSRCYIKTTEYDKAERTLQIAQTKLSSDTAQKSILHMLIYCYGCAGNLDALQQTRKEYVARFPKDKDARMVSEEITYYDGDFTHTRKREANGNPVNMAGYLPWMQFTKLPTMPIKIFVSAGKDLSKGSPMYSKATSDRYAGFMKQALAKWAGAANDKLTYKFVDNASDAQMRCEWTTDLKSRAHSWADGQANYLTNSSQGTVCTLAQIYLDPRERMSDVSFYYVSLHEIGHALGIQHTSNPSDIMYHAARTRPLNPGHALPHLSKGDVALIQALYTEPFLGSDLAEDFAESAFIKKDYEKAYKMLTSDESAKISLSRFEEKMRREQSENPPVNLRVTHFDRASKSGYLHYGLEGRNSQEKFHYYVGVVRMADGELKVSQANRVFIERLKHNEAAGSELLVSPGR